MQTKSLYALYLMVYISALSCTGKNSAERKVASIVLTDQQITDAGIKTVKIVKRIFHDTIVADGIVEPSDKDIISVAAPIRSVLKRIVANDGVYVRKGDILAILGHTDIIKLEQAYLEARSEYNFRRTDLERQGELGLEHATSLKIQQVAQNNYQKAEIRYRSLKKQLELIGINADSLSADNIGSEYFLKAPSKGYLTYVNTETGKLYDESVPLFTLSSGMGNIIKFILPDSITSLIGSYSQFIFFSTTEPGLKYNAILTQNKKNPSLKGEQMLIAKILAPSVGLKTGTPVNAEFVYTDSAWAIPSVGIFSLGNKDYVFFIKNMNHFVPVEIKIRKTENGLSSLSSGFSEIRKYNVAVSGIDYLKKLFKKQHPNFTQNAQ